MLCCTVLHCTVLYSIVLHSTELYCLISLHLCLINSIFISYFYFSLHLSFSLRCCRQLPSPRLMYLVIASSAHLVLSCLVLSCPVLSCPVLSCPVLSCPVLSYLILSCYITPPSHLVLLYSILFFYIALNRSIFYSILSPSILCNSILIFIPSSSIFRILLYSLSLLFVIFCPLGSHELPVFIFCS